MCCKTSCTLLSTDFYSDSSYCTAVDRSFKEKEQLPPLHRSRAHVLLLVACLVSQPIGILFRHISTRAKMVPSPCRRPASGAAKATSMLLGVLLISTPSSLFVSGFQTARPVQVSPLTGTGRHTIDHHNQHLNSNRWEQQRRRNNQEGSSTSLNFMGSDGGLFGIGTPELVRYLSSLKGSPVCQDWRLFKFGGHLLLTLLFCVTVPFFFCELA